MMLSGGVYIVLLLLHLVQGDEPHCSKFDFEEKVLEKLVKMEFQMERLKLEMQGTKETVGNMKNTIEQTVEVVNKKEETLTSKMDRLESFKDTLGEEIKSNLATEIANFKELALKPKPIVAFKARLNDNIYVQHVHSLVFPEVIRNEGNGYDNTSGVFTAPVNGTYLFTAAFCVINNYNIVFTILINSIRQSTTLLRGDASNSCHSADAVSFLKAGQYALVQVIPGGHTGHILDAKSDNYRWNTFSGMLVNG